MRLAWFRSAALARLLLPTLVIGLSVTGFLIASKGNRDDRRDAARRQAELESVRTRGVLGTARAYVVGLSNALAGEPSPTARRFAELQGTAAGSVGLTDALWVEKIAAPERAAYERRIGRPISQLGASGTYRTATSRRSYLPATFATGARPAALRRGVDVSSWPSLAAALRDRASVFSVAASRPGTLAGQRGFFVLQSARFGRGPGSHGFLVVFVPRGWLTVALEGDPRQVAIALDGQRLEGNLTSRPAASGQFAALSRRWNVAVGAQSLSGLRDTLPLLALLWPCAAVALGYAVLRGVLGRRKAEREVERIFDMSVDLLGIANLNGYFIRVNPAFEATLGYTSAELTARPFIEFVHPDDRESTIAALSALAHGREVIQFDNRYVRPDGSYRWLQWSTRPRPDEGLIYAAARDITDSRRAADELRESRQALGRLADGQASLRLLATLVAREAPLDEVLGAVVSEAHRLLRAELTTLSRQEPDGSRTLVGPLGLRNPHVADYHWNGHQAAADSETAAMVLGPMMLAEGIVGAVASTIVVAGAPWGSIVVGWRQTPPPTETAERLAEFAEIAGIAISNANSRRELAASRARVVAASDETRRRIERDLHDGTQQQLLSLVLGLRATEAKVPPALDDLRSDISETAEALTSAVEGIQEMSRGIHPAILARGGLEPAFRALARRAGLPVELDIRVDHDLPEPVEVAAYYVVSEALTNAAKHAHASVVSIAVGTAGGSIRLVVHDDGVGGADPRHGSGLVGLSDRVLALGGAIVVTSPAGAGTTLSASIPIDAAVPTR